MRISDHYSPYADNTYIVVSNSHLARLFKAADREVEEIEVLELAAKEHNKEHLAYSADPEEHDQQARINLYQRLSKHLDEMVPHPEHLVICVPEANKHELVAALAKYVQKDEENIIPKNLASLPIDAIVRILQERQS